MKSLLLLSALCLFPALGRAQAIIHQAALDQLAGIMPPPAAASPPAPAVRHARRIFIRHRRIPLTVAAFKPPALPAPTKAPPAKPLPAAIRAAPPAAVALHFAAGSSDLPPGTMAALKPLCAAAEPSGTVGIDAGAGGGDPSTAMRLAMARAFAVRDALTACGISPARIIPRALAPGAGGDTARVTLGQ